MRAWVVRDKSGEIDLYLDQPVKAEYYPFWEADGTFMEILESDLPSGINPQWEDEEPTEIEITIKRVKQDETI